jgi:hypothetical protein
MQVRSHRFRSMRLSLQRWRAHSAIALTCILGVPACSSSTAPLVMEGVIVAPRSNRLAVTNGRSRPIFTFAVGRNAAALVDWFPCVDATSCPPIAQGDTRMLTYHRDGTGMPEREALLYWWHAVPGPNGLRPDSIRVMIVRL